MPRLSPEKKFQKKIEEISREPVEVKPEEISGTAIKDVLKAADIISKVSEEDLDGLINEVGLDPRSVLQKLKALMEYGDTNSVQLQAVDKAMKLLKLLESTDEVGNKFQVNINILDREHNGVNPILIPR